MMHRNAVMNLVETDTFQMLQVPYEQLQLSMLVFLPRKADGLAELQKQLAADSMSQLSDKMKLYQVDLSLPKFKFTSEFQLGKVLADMGMGIAFSPSADFSGMATREKLNISAVIHKAFVAVDEKGTEAAAATAVAIVMSSAGPPPSHPKATFRADHPFVFVIRDNRTGSILFMGRVVNP